MVGRISSISDVMSDIREFSNFIRDFDDSSGSSDDRFHAKLKAIDEKAKALDPKEQRELWRYCLELTEAEFTKSAIVRHGRSKPFGYSGDFQIIDWTYTGFSADPKTRGGFWDHFYHRQTAPKAVCARKTRFGEHLTLAHTTAQGRVSVLNIGSGPAREVKDGATAANLSPKDMQIICLDADSNAIDYARKLLGPTWQESCQFLHKNALRYRPNQQFDLVWSSGLFDYLDTRLAAHLLRTMVNSVKTGGRVVIGNFATTHNTRAWIEWCGDWFLIHRGLSDMEDLIEKVNLNSAKFNVSHELDALQAVRYVVIERLD